MFQQIRYTLRNKMHSVVRKIPLIISLMAVLIVAMICIQRNTLFQEPYSDRWTVMNSISCHYVTEGDALPSAEELTPPPDSIFFHETSCRGGLTSRQACSIESAARLHPKRDVYVFFNSPISEDVLNTSCLSKLKQFKNVKLARLHIVEYSKDTVLSEMLTRKLNKASAFPIQHTADLLRFLTMYKYGGVYLDTDVLVVKSLDALGRNWVAKETPITLNVAAMALGRDQLGRKLVADILNDIKIDYNPYGWYYNGGGALERSLKKLCDIRHVLFMSAATCSGLEIYDPEVIYPIYWQNKLTYFLPGEIPDKTNWDNKSMDLAYSHHLWNHLTYDIKVEMNSPYERLARKYCPSIRKMFGKKFGS